MANKLFVQHILILGNRVIEKKITLINKCLSGILDSTDLEIFLETLEENVIIIAVTFDEASTK